MHRFAFKPLKKASTPTRIAITGADGYSGRYMTELLQSDRNVTEIRNLTQQKISSNLTGDPNKFQPYASNHKGAPMVSTSRAHPALTRTTPVKITNSPLDFTCTKTLEKSLSEIDVFICTYWMRYGFDKNLCPALDQIKLLTDICKNVGVKRMVYLSHTKPDINSKIGYIKAKSEAEKYISSSMDSYGFIRPCLLFGDSASESIVANNTAYLMKKLPVMMFPGDIKKVHIQPVHVRDLSQMAVNMCFDDNGEIETKNGFIDAVGPEKLTFHEFITAYKRVLKLNRLLISTRLPAEVIYQLTKPINYALNDLYVEEGDLKILENDVACSELRGSEGAEYWGKRSFTDWLEENKHEIGSEYINSFQRYYDVEGKSDVFSYN